jgi:hypothetical protein
MLFLLNDLMIKSANGTENDFIVSENIWVNIESFFTTYTFNLHVFHLLGDYG